MKRFLFSIAVLALAVTTQAQSSNLVQSIRLTFVNEAGATNNTTINLTAREAEGFVLNFNKDVIVAQQQTNTPPTFQTSIRQTTQQVLLNTLAQQARADERKQAKVEAFVPLIGVLWDDLTIQEKNQLTTMANKYATNAP